MWEQRSPAKGKNNSISSLKTLLLFFFFGSSLQEGWERWFISKMSVVALSPWQKEKGVSVRLGIFFFILNLIDEGAKLNAYKLNTYHCSCTRRCKNWVEGQSHGNAHLLWREKVDAWVCTCINLPLFVIMQLIAKQIVRWRVSLELMQLQLLCHCG